MAISVAVFVGDAKALIGDVVAELKVGPGAWDDASAAYGRKFLKQRARVLSLIEQANEGATCLLDGSQATVDGLPDELGRAYRLHRCLSRYGDLSGGNLRSGVVLYERGFTR